MRRKQLKAVRDAPDKGASGLMYPEISKDTKRARALYKRKTDWIRSNSLQYYAVVGATENFVQLGLLYTGEGAYEG